MRTWEQKWNKAIGHLKKGANMHEPCNATRQRPFCHCLTYCSTVAVVNRMDDRLIDSMDRLCCKEMAIMSCAEIAVCECKNEIQAELMWETVFPTIAVEVVHDRFHGWQPTIGSRQRFCRWMRSILARFGVASVSWANSTSTEFVNRW